MDLREEKQDKPECRNCKFFEKKTEETNTKEVNKKLSSIKNSILLNIKSIEFNYNEKNVQG